MDSAASDTAACALVTCLLDLPDAALLRILAACGAQGACAAAASCKQLAAVKKQLECLPIFSCACSTKRDLEAAVNDAARRALAGNWGSVDFAVLFVSAEYQRTPKTKWPQRDAVEALELLRPKLPAGCPVVGALTAGVIGVDEAGTAFEADPQAADPSDPKEGSYRGVSLLLGRLPGCQVRLFAARRGPSNGAWPEISGCVPAGFEPRHVVILASGVSGNDDGLQSALQWWHDCAAEPPVVVGGFASGRGHVLVPPPADAAERPASGRGTKQGARYAMAGLVFCSPRDGAAAGGCAAPAGAHVAGPPCGPAAGDAAPADARHLSAAALSVTGTGPLPRSSMLLVDDAALVDQVDDEGELLVGLELGALAVSGEERGIAMNVLLQECMRCKVSPGRMELAVWDTQRAPDCATALLEGKALLNAQVMGGPPEGRVFIGFDGGRAAAEAVLGRGDPAPLRLAVQLVENSHEASRRVLQQQLPRLRRPTGKGNTSGTHETAAAAQSDGDLTASYYALCRENALAAAVRTGPAAALMFACTGRGAAFYGETGVEARLVDGIFNREVPFAGMFAGGEIGPPVAGGMLGRTSCPPGSSSGDNDSVGASPMGTASELQGYTSMIAVISASSL